MAAPLATFDDVAARYPSLATDAARDRIESLLADASGRARAAAGWQQISRVDDDSVILRATGRTLVLPQRPVIDVTAVDGLPARAWTWDGQQLLTRTDGGLWNGAAAVTYSHGLDVGDYALDLAVGIVCEAVIRALAVPVPGVRGETIGDRSYTLAAVSLGGGVELTDADRRTLAAAFSTGVH